MMMPATFIYVPYCSRLASSLSSTVNMPRTTRSRSPIGSEWRYHWSHDQGGRWYRVWFRATRVWLNSVCNSSTTSSSQPVEQPDATSQPTGSAVNSSPIRSASDPAHREPAQFICMLCRFHRPEYSHLTTACHKSPNVTGMHTISLLLDLHAPQMGHCVCVHFSST